MSKHEKKLKLFTHPPTSIAQTVNDWRAEGVPQEKLDWLTKIADLDIPPAFAKMHLFSHGRQDMETIYAGLLTPIIGKAWARRKEREPYGIVLNSEDKGEVPVQFDFDGQAINPASPYKTLAYGMRDTLSIQLKEELAERSERITQGKNEPGDSFYIAFSHYDRHTSQSTNSFLSQAYGGIGTAAIINSALFAAIPRLVSENSGLSGSALTLKSAEIARNSYVFVSELTMLDLQTIVVLTENVFGKILNNKLNIGMFFTLAESEGKTYVDFTPTFRRSIHIEGDPERTGCPVRAPLVKTPEEKERTADLHGKNRISGTEELYIWMEKIAESIYFGQEKFSSKRAQ